MARETKDGQALEHKVRSLIRKHEGKLPDNVARKMIDHARKLKIRDYAHKRDAFNIEAEINRYR